MCGRYAATLPPEAMLELFKVMNQIGFPERFNVAPTQPIVTIWEQNGQRTAQLARWGFVPHWVKDPREFPLLVNARAESMAEKPAFRDALKNQRCIVPVSGYYEWHTGPNKKKQPYYITLVDDQPMVLAGLYSNWHGPNGEEIDTTALITTSANPDVAYIHDRMPAILPMDKVDEWLNTREVNARAALQLALPLPPGSVKSHPVSTRVNSARDDDPGLIEPITLEPSAPAEKPKPRRAGGQMDLF